MLVLPELDGSAPATGIAGPAISTESGINGSQIGEGHPQQPHTMEEFKSDTDHMQFSPSRIHVPGPLGVREIGSCPTG
ncbi:hypothetical protein M3J09_006209 [Ascochyta lentis]